MSSVTKTLLPGIVAGAAVRDANGKRINTYYAKASDLTSLQTTVTTLDGAVVKKASIIDRLDSQTSDAPLSANQGYVLKGMIDAINALLDSDDNSLDTIQEIVTYIKANQTSISSITSTKVNIADIVDALTSTAANKPLSANQGKELKGLIDALTTSLNSLSGDVALLPSSSDVSSAVSTEETRAKAAEQALGTRVTTLEGQVVTLDNSVTSSSSNGVKASGIYSYFNDRGLTTSSSITVTDWED